MKILLTGATGLIGNALGKELVRRGHIVRAAVRDPGRTQKNLQFKAELVAWPDTLLPFDENFLEGIDAIIHLAGEPVGGGRWTPERKKKIHDSRVIGARNLVQAIRAARNKSNSNLRAFITASAIGIYGERGSERLTEQSSHGSDFLAEVSEHWEAELEPLDALNIRRVGIRTGLVLASQGGALPLMLPVFKRGFGSRLGRGDQWVSWIHIDDIVGLYCWALENSEVRGPVNAVAPEPVTNSVFTAELARACGKREFLPVPAFVLRLALGEMAELLLGSLRVSSQSAESQGYRFQHRDIRSSLELLVAKSNERGPIAPQAAQPAP